MSNSVFKKFLIKLNHHRTTEVYFIAYPKTGSTWVRFMLGRYIQLVCKMPKLPLFDGTDWLGRCERACIGPSMNFTHMPLLWTDQTATDLNFDNVIRPFLKKRVVLIIRHPLDALVSNWFQQKYRVKDGFNGSLKEFLDHPVFGLEKFFRFYQLWCESTHRVADFYLLRYEDMKADTTNSFKYLLKFLGIEPAEEILQVSVDYASFENMKKIETSSHVLRYRSSGLSVFATGDRKNPDAFHVRRGKVGGYKDYLDPIAAAQYEELIACKMADMYGYDQQFLKEEG